MKNPFSFFRSRQDKKLKEVQRSNHVIEQETLLINNIRGIINHCNKTDAYFGWPASMAVFAYKELTVVVYPPEGERGSRVLINTPRGQYLTKNQFRALNTEIMGISFDGWAKIPKDDTVDYLPPVNDFLEELLKTSCQ